METTSTMAPSRRLPSPAAADGDPAAQARASTHRTISVDLATYDRLARAAEQTGLSRAQIVDHLIQSRPLRELVRELKAANIRPRPPGRRKTSIFR